MGLYNFSDQIVFKILRDIDQEQNYALGVSGLINNWAFYKAMDIET